MKKNPFRINQTIEIAETDANDFHKVLIQDMNSRLLYVTIPVSKGQAHIVPKGDEMKGRVIDQGAVFEFLTVSHGTKTGADIPLLMIAVPQKYIRNQRRDHFRQEVVMPIEYQIEKSKRGGTKQEEEAKEHQGPWHKGRILDISGGGIRLAADEPIPNGAVLRLRIDLREQREGRPKFFFLSGRIVRKNLSPPSQEPNMYSLAFEEISQTVQDRIVNFVFSVQGKTLGRR